MTASLRSGIAPHETEHCNGLDFKLLFKFSLCSNFRLNSCSIYVPILPRFLLQISFHFYSLSPSISVRILAPVPLALMFSFPIETSVTCGVATWEIGGCSNLLLKQMLTRIFVRIQAPFLFAFITKTCPLLRYRSVPAPLFEFLIARSTSPSDTDC
jgi:hypothetical protein